MSKQSNFKPEYGNWVSNRLLFGSGGLGMIFIGLSLIHWSLLIPAFFFFAAFGYFIYAHHKFSPMGGNLQNRIRNLVLDYLEWDGHGEALDIGCGNGPLVIGLAKKYPECKVTGIDYWGSAWDYSQKECEKNASFEGVSNQVVFKKGNASNLPFSDETFEAAVSNFVFHEVADIKDKKDLVKEGLRVVKKGGVFSFQDLFLVKNFYGEPDDLLRIIKSWGIEKVDMKVTKDMAFIPVALKLPFMVGEIGIIYGKK